MKIILTIALILFVLNSWAISQNTAEDKDKLNRANSQLVTKYKLGEYDDALKFAKIALDLAISTFGADHVETAKSYKNIGEIYRVKRKYRESAENFQKAYLIYQKDIVRNGELIGKILDSLGTVLALDGKKAEAEPLLLQAASNAEAVFGKETKETLPALKTLTSFYIYTKQYDKADDIFLRRYIIYSILEKKKRYCRTRIYSGRVRLLQRSAFSSR
ncbi:MAG: tetratricopeptide repeat protein [Pyrinomonadaceae bacterium]